MEYVTGVVRTNSDLSKENAALVAGQGTSPLARAPPLDWTAVSAESMQLLFLEQKT
jgi:hypothetical protein